jgi:predicted ATPase
MALDEHTRRAPTTEESLVDARLVDALDHLVGTLDGASVPARGEATQRRPALASGDAKAVRAPPSFIKLLGPRLRHSRRLRYRIPRIVIRLLGYGFAALAVMMLVSLLTPR